jgi:hypothetical protein
VSNSIGFLLEAIRQNYANPKFGVAEQQKEAQRQRETKVAREWKLEQWREECAGLERRRRAEVHELCKTMLVAAPALAEEAVEARLAEVPWFKKQYEPGTSALENYQRVPFLWVEVDRYLEERCAERFRAIQARDDRQMAEISEKIGAPEPINT